MGHVLQATDLHYVYVVKKTKQSPAMRDDPYSAPPYVEYKVGHSCNPENRVNSSSAGDKYIGDVLYLAFCVSSDKGERKRLATSLEANIVRELHTCGYQVEGGEPNTEVEVFTCGGKKEPNEITRVIERRVENDPDFKLATITNAPVRQLEWTCEPTPGYRLTRANGELFVRTVVPSGDVETTEQPPPPRDEKVPLDISIPLDDDLFWDKYLTTAPTETQRAEMKRVLDEGGNALRQRYQKAVEYAILKGELLMEKDKHHHKSVYFEDHLDLWSRESVLIWIDRAEQYGRETFGQGQLAAALRTHFMKMYGGHSSRKRKRNRSLKR